MNGKSYSTKKLASSAARREETASDDICAEHSWAGRQSAKLYMGGAERTEPELLIEAQ